MLALIFVLDTLFTLVVIAFLLRLLLPLFDAGFRNPIGEAVLKLTDPLVLLLRKVLKTRGRIDVASIVALAIVQLAATAVLLAVQGLAPPGLVTVVVVAFRSLLDTVLQFFTVCLLIYVVLSWIAPAVHNPAVQLLSRVCEPLLRPVRRVIPPLGGLDLSPLFALIALQAVRILLR